MKARRAKNAGTSIVVEDRTGGPLPWDRTGVPLPGGRPAAHVGAWLHRARETRGITVADVALTTKIKIEFLEELERGRLESLPAAVFVRGFVRSIARAVGADPDEAAIRLAADYEARKPGAPPPTAIGEAAQSIGPGEGEGRRRVAVALVVIVLLIAATLTLSLLLHRAMPTSGGIS